jgi:NAD(P)-dependent dehydrogenase (short-subunit alcohol dehydrogenase family)
MAVKRRTAVVTGASRAIGRAAAIALARQHYAVWALARSADQVDALCSSYPVDAGETL